MNIRIEEGEPAKSTQVNLFNMPSYQNNLSHISKTLSPKEVDVQISEI